MVKTIDMQEMRYLNLFAQITGVSTHFCFKYNEGIFFCVPKPMVARSLGEGGRNARKLSEIIGKKVRVIPVPRDINDAEAFLSLIISPLTVRDFNITDTEIIVGGGKNKAALIGRNKRRLMEMQRITSDFFSREFRIV